MSKTINNKEYRLKLFKEKIDKSTLKIENNINDKKQNKYIKCPHCKSEDVIKYGSYNGIQRYKCKNNKCERTFTKQTESPFRYSKKFKENCHKYKELYEKGLTIRECAEILNISIVTSFFWRHRFLYNLKQVNYVEKLCDYAELTRVVLLENFKGDRYSKNKEKDKISIVNAMNKSIDIISIIAARNHLGFRELKENIEPRIDKKAIAVAFLDGRLQAFSDKHNTINKIRIRRIDITPIDASYSLKIKRWLKKFRGVATKYIDHYLSWRANEYKNNIEYDYRLNKDEKLNLNINLNIKITTYVSWNNIKSKVLPV
ncbi:hypothetical protein [Clostridium sp.]|uniref:transposase-like zinc-binding domain-containing protein n=1 Tax=Clostridium sp. TaxID=1506 RepID=UPI001B7222D6|nr:hypothetical protein [Clostridium sp.]MBP3916112.1 IS1 family transposase [Clostridium sp.]